MKTKTIGEILRDEREKHRLSIEKLAKKTRIKEKYLRALEDNQFDQLPAATFVRGYIKIYSQLFGFDHQPLVALLRRDFKESVKGRLVPREFIKPILKKRQNWGPATFVVLGLALTFITLISYAGFQWYLLAQPPELKIMLPIEDSLVAARVGVSGQTDIDAIVTVNSQPVALQTDGSFETEVYLPREGINTISIESQDRRGKTILVQRSVRVKF
ncbi:MAG: helix-turn-helix domain-containing protein [Candidatus Pacebacteria bacterium]|jgi:transcriptional regulator with XRE-family HTH domain|nr:helix-turn-helix domain-containing protein [Candidatus Paceibacterota bacterium]MBT3511548.1 helix-turn-helix domain-containing protein [Candidatus Paceibacterota bacterium]MBT4004982.1 helix-turn-helix domain-containing protein [Candidatus Paceibacterota bacterium]MBT4358758.1 helix-turn-helix domain-containing protein [Candidatus Paceibacterota bacterium]MBT4680907.1 helix-turn-helix domain-containing protein [Candidatus Paceibacterota bacterium]